MVLLALSLAPIAFILLYVYLRDEYDKEPLKHLIFSFIGGILIAIPVVWVGNWLSGWWSLGGGGMSIPEVMLYAFVVVAFTEEGMKYIVMRWYCYDCPSLMNPMTGSCMR